MTGPVPYLLNPQISRLLRGRNDTFLDERRLSTCSAELDLAGGQDQISLQTLDLLLILRFGRLLERSSRGTEGRDISEYRTLREIRA